MAQLARRQVRISVAHHKKLRILAKDGHRGLNDEVELLIDAAYKFPTIKEKSK